MNWLAFQEWIGPQVVDGILEDVRMHMEINDPKHNQRRVSVVKYLAELYNYRLVDSSVIFKVLYSLISFGASLAPNEINYFDPPDHLLRIRLVCVILDTCGIYFNSGSSKKKLDYFCTYFQASVPLNLITESILPNNFLLQRYYWRKRASSVWDEKVFAFSSATQLIHECLPTLRPKIKLFNSLEEADDAVAVIEKEVLASVVEKAPELGRALQSAATGKPLENASGGLHTIAEGEEDEEEGQLHEVAANDPEEEDDDESDDDDAFDGSEEVMSYHSRSRSQSQAENLGDYEEGEEAEIEEEDSSRGDDDSDEEDEDELSEEDEEQEEPTLVYVPCEEDDEFKAMFDKMLNDNIAEGRGAIPRGQQVSVVAPLHSKAKKNYGEERMI